MLKIFKTEKFSRYEFKFLLSQKKAMQIENEIKSFMILDENAFNKKDKKYFVRSLYFDTPEYSNFYEKVDGIKCYRMTGNVSTKNNGGFIQMRTKLSPEINSKDYDGVYVKVYGNEKNYNLHLRTGLTLAPWQYYSYTFETTKNWIEIRAPFKKFKKSNFYQPKSILGQNIKSVGLVAGFDDFKSDICLSEIGFY